MRFMQSIFLFFCCLSMCMPISAATGQEAMRSFDGTRYRYLISYPSSWKLYDHGDGVVVFKQQETKADYPISVNIQTIFTAKEKGDYATVKALMNDFEKNAKQHADAVKFIDRHPLTLVQPDGTRLQGEQTTMTFKDHGKLLKQWQVMIVTKDGSLFQAFAYRAPVDQYQKTLPYAKKMLESWVIN